MGRRPAILWRLLHSFCFIGLVVPGTYVSPSSLRTSACAIFLAWSVLSSLCLGNSGHAQMSPAGACCWGSLLQSSGAG